MNATLLIADDEPANLALLTRILKPYYRVRVANSGEAALRVARSQEPPDLILLDVMMPDLDGYQVIERLRQSPRTLSIPVIFVSALADDLNEERGLLLGAVDYIVKPVKPAIVLARVSTQIELKRARDQLQSQNATLETEVAARMRENNLIQLVSIRALAHLAETRDPETGNHILRTQAYVQALAERLRQHPRFAHCLSAANIDRLVKSAPLHDIGKVGIPDQILLKPGPLSPQERTVIETHTLLGARAIERAEADVQESIPFLNLAKEIARWHHERWDGTGYPDRLAGESIPIGARLMALADVFDALISPRVYKAPMPILEARAIILAERGRQFDPDVVGVFEQGFEDFVRIAGRYADSGDEKTE
jgi:putative two-component system response regulator